jgi:hypothetical protein
LVSGGIEGVGERRGARTWKLQEGREVLTGRVDVEDVEVVVLVGLDLVVSDLW